MGLALEVGILADLLENDPEGAQAYEEYFAEVNALLLESHLAAHSEPLECEVWSADMFGYSGLHYLRRVGAHLDSKGRLPSPGTQASADDPVLRAYVREGLGQKPGILSRLFQKPHSFSRGFDHLILHGDGEGFYLPLDFEEVLFGLDSPIPGGMVGSATRLHSELDRIAEALEIPADLDSQSETLWLAADSQGEGVTTWERYGVESFSCVVLREGCRRCMASGAALVFC